MLSSLKCAVVTPLLKKAGRDEEDLSSYRPISNLPFLSKRIEKLVARRIEHLHDRCQSAYRKDHSTETALIKVLSDISDTLDHESMAELDLSAEFDVIDQTFGVYFWH